MENKYTKEEILLAGMLGELNKNDINHLASLLDEASEIIRKSFDCRTCKHFHYNIFDDMICDKDFIIPEVDCNGVHFELDNRFLKK